MRASPYAATAKSMPFCHAMRSRYDMPIPVSFIAHSFNVNWPPQTTAAVLVVLNLATGN
jgi:hypothetical protein